MQGWDVLASLVILGLTVLCQWLVRERGRLLRLCEHHEGRLAVSEHFQGESHACVSRMGDEAMRREAALRDALAERDACHGLLDDVLRALGHDPAGGHPGVVDAAKRAATDLARLRWLEAALASAIEAAAEQSRMVLDGGAVDVPQP